MRSAFKPLALIGILLLFGKAYGQQFIISNIYADRGKIYVNFKIDGRYEHERYQIQLYSSHDGYAKPLTHVTGPIEGEVTNTDEELQVVWDAQKELKKFEGNIQLELKGQVTYVPVHLNNPGIKAKQTKSTPISWDGGEPQDQIRIELIKSGQVVQSLGEVQNSGRYEWQVTKDIPKGDGYALRLINLNNSGETIETDVFKVTSKVGLAVKLAPVGALVVGGGIYALTSGLLDPHDGDDDELPGPPNPEDM